METVDFIVTTSDRPAGHSLACLVSDKRLEITPPCSSSNSAYVSGTLRSLALPPARSYLHLTSKHYVNEQLKGLPQFLWEFTWRQ